MKAFPMKNSFGETLNITVNPYTKHVFIHVDKCFFHVTSKKEVDAIIDILLKYKEEAYGNKSD